MFVDASAIVAILTNEPEADALTDRLEHATRPITSAIAIFEATFALCRKRHARADRWRAERPEGVNLSRKQCAIAYCSPDWTAVCYSVEEAETDVSAFLTIARITLVPITASDATVALKAFSRYGKGRGHPAQLNMGDCFAYASAKSNHTSLLYKGDDFAQTDVTTA